MAKDFLMGPDGDLFIENGRAQLVEGADQVKQAWVIRMRTFLWEWFLDTSIGMPYVQEIFAKNLSLARLKEIIMEETLKTPGVIAVNNVVVGDINPSTREVDCTVYADIEGEDNAVFYFPGVP